MREHDVTALTAAELEAARRELAASLALARPGSPVRAPIQARLENPPTLYQQILSTSISNSSIPINQQHSPYKSVASKPSNVQYQTYI